MGHGAKTMYVSVAMLYIPIWLILLVVIHILRIRSRKSMSLAQFWWNGGPPDGKKFPNLVILCVVKVTIMFESVIIRFCHYL